MEKIKDKKGANVGKLNGPFSMPRAFVVLLSSKNLRTYTVTALAENGSYGRRYGRRRAYVTLT